MSSNAGNIVVPNLSRPLLTVEEAAVIARCSIKTVRRAYANGSLSAYRRRGSRAVLLDPQDVGEWVRGQLVHAPSTPAGAGPARAQGGVTTPSPARRRRAGAESSRATPVTFDLSTGALQERRTAKATPSS